MARVLCVLFALVGLLPIGLGLLVRSEPIGRWAAAETARILEEQLAIRATYRIELTTWPLELGLRDLVVPATDGGTPALRVQRAAMRPRLLALLAGRFDAGTIELEGTRARIVLREGKLANVSYRLPESKAPAQKLEQAPFTSLLVRDAEAELDIDGVRVQTGKIELEARAHKGPTFELTLRARGGSLSRQRPRPVKSGEPLPDAHDEDSLCELDAKLRTEARALIIESLSASARSDLNPAAGTRPPCSGLTPGALERVALSAKQLRIAFGPEPLPAVSGELGVRAPLALVNRFVRMTPLAGFAEITGQVSYDGKMRLPALRGTLAGEGIALGAYRLAKRLAVSFAVAEDIIHIPRYEMHFADGTVVATNSVIQPFAEGVPITTERVDGQGVSFSAMMRDLDVTENTIIRWDLRKTLVQKVAGTLNPLRIGGEFRGETHDFEVFDRAYHDPKRKHVIGVRAANVRGRVLVTAAALKFLDTRADFGKSRVNASLVSIGFSNDLDLRIEKGSRIELSDITPLLDIPMKGTAELALEMHGKGGDPLLTGDLAVQSLEFGGFPLGNITSGKVQFRPLYVEFSEVRGQKGRSEFLVPHARLDFDAGSAVLADAVVKSDRLMIRDFFAMWLFDTDPRFADIDGEGAVEARIHYDLGGKADRCKGGLLRVEGGLNMRRLLLFDESYDGGKGEFDFRWSDMNASYLGVDLDVPSFSLRKGAGTLLGSFNVSQGAAVRGRFIGSSVPLAKIDALGALGLGLDGSASIVGEVSGRLDELALTAQVGVSPVRIGRGSLPASNLTVRLLPVVRTEKPVGKSACGHPIYPRFDAAEYELDHSSGIFEVSGALFGGQIQVRRAQLTRQRNKQFSGELVFDKLDIGAASEFIPAVALSPAKPQGKLSGALRVQELHTNDPSRASAQLTLHELTLSQSGVGVELLPSPQPIVIANRRLQLPGVSIAVRTAGGAAGIFDVQGTIDRLGRGPQVNATLALRPTDLSQFRVLVPRADRLRGEVSGALRLTGAPASLAYRGGFVLKDGEIWLRGFPSPVSDVQVEVALDNDELRLTRGAARVGNGTISVKGGAPLRGLEIGAVRATVTARELSLPARQGLRTVLDADLVANWRPTAKDGERRLPRVTGDVNLRSFEYNRPVSVTADLAALTQRGKRTEFESYDPADDRVEFDVTVRSNRSLRITNNLVEMELETEPQGLLLAGTNQRFGLRGALKVKPGGRIRLRQTEFEVRQGFVRFDDLTRVAPQVDLTATTEYRRYSDSLSASATAARSDMRSGTTSMAGGRWLITLHAHGDADKLKIDLASEPPLAQDDVFLLLTVGLTRAELDQAQSASVGESVALEALGALTGADRAVREAVPLIDEFRFGSAYSTRTGRTEPTITIGKRLAERIRANVTSGLSESREIRSNVEWRLNPRVSVEGSYDNVNDISSSSLGNLGADIRWRLEFE